MYIDHKSFAKIAKKHNNIKWAQRHYLDEDVFDTYQVSKNEFLDGYEIDCSIYPQYDYYSATTNILINNDGQILHHVCNCDFNSANSACGHVIAALYLFETLEQKEIPYYKSVINPKDDYRKLNHQNFDVANSRDILSLDEHLERIEKERNEAQIKNYILEGQGILEKLKTINNDYIELIINSDEEKISLYFMLNIIINKYSMDLSIEAKIGKENNKKTYVVKDFIDLINLVKRKMFYRYGKELEFNHSLDVFDDFSQKSLKLIMALYPHYSYGFNNIREIPIDSNNIDNIFDLFIDAPKNNLIKGNFSEKQLKLLVNVTRMDNYYLLNINEDNYFFGSEGIYHANEETNTITSYQVKNLNEFKTFLLSLKEGIMISDEEWQEFLSYIYSLFPETIILEGDFEEVYTYEDMIEMYVDLDDIGLNIDIIAYYEGEKHNVLASDFDQALSLNARSLIRVIGRYGYIEGDSLIVEFNKSNFEEVLERIIPRLDQHFNIYISENLKNFKKQSSLNLDLNIRMDSNLLEIDLNSIKYTPEEIKDIMYAYQKKKKFHKLRNGQMIKLNYEELEEVDNVLQELNLKASDLKDGKQFIPLHNAFKLNNQLKTSENLGFNVEKEVNVFIKRFKENNIDKQVIHERFNDILKPYQRDGVNWLLALNQYQFGGILADDMGLGKTLQVISLLESIKSKTSLIVVPASLMYNWEEELQKFNSSLKHLCIHGNKSQRKQMIESYQDYDVLITTYDYLLRDIDTYRKCSFYYLVLDEAHYIKNRLAKKAQAIKTINSQVKLALTGTPIENSLAELWSIFDFLMPNYLLTYQDFREKYESKIIRENDQQQTNKLKKLVEPFILRRTKQEVLKDLPEKIEKIVYIDFSNKEEKLYLSKLANVNKELQSFLDIEEKNKILILKMLLELRQICCEPRLLYENITNTSSKLEVCLELIEMLQESKKPVLIFSSFTKTLDLIEKELLKKKVVYLKLTGSNQKSERKNMVSLFQKGEVDVFLISLKAGSVGLNLTKAQAVIHFDPWWNISAQNQATDRAYRIGQANDVHVFSLIMKNSIEEKILQLQKSKQEISDTFVEKSEGSLSKMSTDDIVELLKRDK